MRTVAARVLALAALALVLLPAAGADAARARRAPTGLLALHADPDRRRGGRILDEAGREVLLRGVNVNALAEYWQGGPFQTTFPLAEGDPRLMAGIGWNAVRLLLSWSRVEPAPGSYDAAYLSAAAGVVERLRRVGIYTILDLHQDAWGPSLAARPDEACGSAPPALGWDGAPAWATLDGGALRCVTGFRELAPAVRAAWSAFFADAAGPGGVGVQTRYLAMLRHVARRFARLPAVAGIDVVNEPNALGAGEQAGLARFYGRALRAVRAGERVRGGRRHLVLFEPSVLWSATGRGAPPDFARDRDVVYAPHVYTGGFTGLPITRSAFQAARDEARGFGGAPVLSGEWGADPDRALPSGDGYFLAHQRLQDVFRIGATLWTWRESCGDPHKLADARAGLAPRVWGEFEVDCATNQVTGVRAALVAQLTRAYVRAAPGRLARASYDPGTGRFVAVGRAARTGDELVAFYPRGKHGGMRARTTGLRRLRVAKTPDGGRLISAAPRGGRWSLTVSAR